MVLVLVAQNYRLEEIMKEAETWYCKSSVEVFSEGIASVVLKTQELKGYGEG